MCNSLAKAGRLHRLFSQGHACRLPTPEAVRNVVYAALDLCVQRFSCSSHYSGLSCFDTNFATCVQEQQRKREAPPPPPLVQASPDLSEDAAAAENTAAMAVAAGEVAAATAQVHAAVPGSEEHKSAEVSRALLPP